MKEFETLINAKITEVQSKNADDLNFEGDLKILENIISLKELDDILNRSKSQFRAEIAKIVGNNVDSSIQIWKALNMSSLEPFWDIKMF